MEKLEGFSNATKIWVYQSNRLLTPSEISSIEERLAIFSKEWATHGELLKTACFIIAPCFIVMAVDQQHMSASGCSVDSSYKVLKELEKEFGIDLFDRMNLSFENSNQEVEIISMNEFRKGLGTGLFDENTVVFNNLVTTLEEFRSNWKTIVKNSWHNSLI